APGLALPAWLVTTLALAADEGPEPWSSRVRRWLLPIAFVGFALGALFGVVGSLTTLVQDWTAPFEIGADPALGARHVTRADWFVPFQYFAFVCLLWSALNLAILWRASPPGTPLRARFAWLTASAVMFVLGGSWVILGSGDYFLVGLPGQLLLIAGML